MNATKLLLAVGAVLVVAAAVLGVILANRQAEPSQAPPLATSALVVDQQPVQPPPPTEAAPPPTIPEVPALPDTASSKASVTAPPLTPRPQPTSVPPPSPSNVRKKPELQDPVAREALALVGMDPEAEAYWLEAIYDASLPNEEREDLMEDLNEDGLSDFKHPGPWDLPLIINRLYIIEEVAPYADEFMLRHLGEAYKDLVNLAAVAQGGGEPVR